MVRANPDVAIMSLLHDRRVLVHDCGPHGRAETSVARLVGSHPAAGSGQAADVVVLLPQPLELLVLGREPGDGKRLERGELGQRLVPFRDWSLESATWALSRSICDVRGSGASPASRWAFRRRSNSSPRCW